MGATATVDFFGKDLGLTKLTQSIDNRLQRLGRNTKLAFTGVIAARTFRSTFDLLSKSVTVAEELAAAQTRLNAVYRATGNSALYSAGQSEKLATQLAKVTKFSANANIEAQAVLATFKNVRGDIFRDAILAAQDMSEIFKKDLKQSVIQLGKALNDPVAGMNSLRDVGHTFSESQQEVIKKLVETGKLAEAQRFILDKLKSEFGGAAVAAGQGLGGQLNNLSEAFDANLQQIGKWVSGGLVQLVDWTAVAGGAMTAFYGNMQRVGELTLVSAQIGLLAFQETWNHIFTVVAPAASDWFYRNWKNILLDIGELQSVIFKNMLKNVQEFMDGVRNLLNGDAANFEFTALTEGFERSIEKLPEIAERKLTQAEIALRNRFHELGGSFVDDADRAADDIRGAYGLGKNDPEKTIKNLPKPDLKPRLNRVGNFIGGSLDAIGKALTGKGVAGAFEGLGQRIIDAQETAAELFGEAKSRFDDDRKSKSSAGEQVGLKELFDRIQGSAAKAEKRAVLETRDATKDTARNVKVVAFHAERTGNHLADLSNAIGAGFTGVFGK